MLWVGTRLGGVHKWNPLSWQFGHVAPRPRQPARGLGSGHVTSFSEDRAGRLWIGTFDAGLYVMDRTTGEMTAYRHDARKPRAAWPATRSWRCATTTAATSGSARSMRASAGWRADGGAFKHYRSDSQAIPRA